MDGNYVYLFIKYNTHYMANRKLFVQPTFNLAKNGVKQQIVAGVKQGWVDATPAIQGMIAAQTASLAKGAIQTASNRMNQGISSPKLPTKAKNSNNMNSNAGGSLVFKGSPQISDTNASYALSKSPNPKKISLNSGIRPNAFSNDSMSPIENACSPLHVCGIKLQIPSSATNPLASYFTNTICFDIQTRAQANVGFGLDITNKLSTTQLRTAFNAVIYALQIYFWYSSILSYESNSKNKNAGMIFLRSTIDATTLSDLAQLGRRLEDCTIPPHVVEWVRYMSGNFLSSDSSGSPLLKIHQDPNLLRTGFNGFCAAALSGLANDANNTVFSLLRNCIPKWRIGTLYDCPTVPTFDKQFLSLFANLPSANLQVSTLATSGSVAANNIAIPYNSYSNVLDGVAFSMSNVFNTTSSEFIPGLTVNCSVDVNNRDNKMSYYSVSGTKAFYNVYAYPFLSASRQETTTYNGATVSTPHLFGTDRLQNVTGEALIQSAEETLDYLFDTDSIAIKGKLPNFNRRVR